MAAKKVAGKGKRVETVKRKFYAGKSFHVKVPHPSGPALV